MSAGGAEVAEAPREAAGPYYESQGTRSRSSRAAYRNRLQIGIDDWYRSLRRGAPMTSAAAAWAEAAHLVWGDLAGP